MWPHLGYDPVQQFTRITQTVRTPKVLVVDPQRVSASNLAGVAAWLQQNAGSTSCSSSGIGSSDHLTMEMFWQVTGPMWRMCPMPAAPPR